MSGIGLRAFGARRDTSNLPSASITLVSRVLQCNGWWYFRDACTRHQGIPLVERRLVLLAVVRFFFFFGMRLCPVMRRCHLVAFPFQGRNECPCLLSAEWGSGAERAFARREGDNPTGKRGMRGRYPLVQFWLDRYCT